MSTTYKRWNSRRELEPAPSCRVHFEVCGQSQAQRPAPAPANGGSRSAPQPPQPDASPNNTSASLLLAIQENTAVLRELVAELRQRRQPARRGNRINCPFCRGNSTNTFSYDPVRALWHCHRCLGGGDALRLVELIHHCGFSEALRFLARALRQHHHVDARPSRTRGRPRREATASAGRAAARR